MGFGIVQRGVSTLLVLKLPFSEDLNKPCPWGHGFRSKWAFCMAGDGVFVVPGNCPNDIHQKFFIQQGNFNFQFYSFPLDVDLGYLKRYF